MSSEVISFFLSFQHNIKLYHWHTTLYSRHKATDDLHIKLSDLIDEFVEVYMGKYGRKHILKKHTNITLVNNDDELFVKYLEYGIQFISVNITKSLDKKDTDLFNIKDEMLSILNKTLYLCTLS